MIERVEEDLLCEGIASAGRDMRSERERLKTKMRDLRATG